MDKDLTLREGKDVSQNRGELAGGVEVRHVYPMRDERWRDARKETEKDVRGAGIDLVRARQSQRHRGDIQREPEPDETDLK